MNKGRIVCGSFLKILARQKSEWVSCKSLAEGWDLYAHGKTNQGLSDSGCYGVESGTEILEVKSCWKTKFWPC